MRISTNRAIFIYISNFELASGVYQVSWHHAYIFGFLLMLVGGVCRIIGEGFVEHA